MCVNLIVNFFVSKITNVVSEDDKEKGRYFEVAVGTKDKIWIQAVDLL